MYKAIILSIVLYGCETLTLTLKEKNGLKVFEKRILRQKYGLHNEEPYFAPFT